MSLGSQVRKYRKQMGWTLEELEKRSGVARGTISALEKRDSNKSEFAGKLAAVFGLTVEQLLDESAKHLHSERQLLPTAPGSILSQAETKLLDAFRMLGKPEQDYILAKTQEFLGGVSPGNRPAKKSA